MKSYKQLTRDQRYVIKTLLQEGYTYRKIAKRVGRCVGEVRGDRHEWHFHEKAFVKGGI